MDEHLTRHYMPIPMDILSESTRFRCKGRRTLDQIIARLAQSARSSVDLSSSRTGVLVWQLAACGFLVPVGGAQIDIRLLPAVWRSAGRCPVNPRAGIPARANYGGK